MMQCSKRHAGRWVHAPSEPANLDASAFADCYDDRPIQNTGLDFIVNKLYYGYA